MRAHPIETGKIFIDENIDLTQMDTRATRSIFGFVSQTPFIFSGTIRENLVVNAGLELPDVAILKILNKAGLGKSNLKLWVFFILGNWLQRYGGLDAEVMESGSNFSFGEKQIICLCRMILARPRVSLHTLNLSYCLDNSN